MRPFEGQGVRLGPQRELCGFPPGPGVGKEHGARPVLGGAHVRQIACARCKSCLRRAAGRLLLFQFPRRFACDHFGLDAPRKFVRHRFAELLFRRCRGR